MLFKRRRLSTITLLALSLTLSSTLQADEESGYSEDADNYSQSSSNSFGVMDTFLPTGQNHANLVHQVGLPGPEPEGINYGYHIDTGGYYQTSSNSFEVVDAFLPTWQNHTNLLFIDARGVDHQGPELEGNVGLGYRHLFGGDHWLWGMTASYDVEKSQEANIFYQAIVGEEFKTTDWVSDINAFIPFGDTTKAAARFNQSYFTATETAELYHLMVSAGEERAMPGMDAEWGYRFLPDFIGYVGGYYYGATGVKPITGPRARLTYDWNNPLNATGIWKELINRITFETAVQHDSQAQTQWYIGLRLRVGLGSQPSDASDNPVIRDMTAYVNRGENVGNGLDVATARVDTGFQVVTAGEIDGGGNTGGGGETGLPAAFWFPSDGPDLNTNPLRNTANFIVITSDFTGVDPITLQNSQYLTGGSFTVTYLGTTYTINQGLSKPTLTEDTGVGLQAAGNALVTVGQGNTINSLVLAVNNVNTTDAIANAGAYGATGESVDDLTVNNVNTNSRLYFNIGDGSQTSSIHLIDDNVTLSRSGASNAPIGGIDFATQNASTLTADLEGGSVSTAGSYAAGILNGSGSTLTLIKDMILTTSGQEADGIYNLGTITQTASINTIENNDITTTGDGAAGIFNNIGTIASISGNTIETQEADGINNLGDVNRDASINTIENNDITTTGTADTHYGIYNSLGTISASINDNTITVAKGYGIYNTDYINAIASNTIHVVVDSTEGIGIEDIANGSGIGHINSIAANTIQASWSGIYISSGTVDVIGGATSALGNSIMITTGNNDVNPQSGITVTNTNSAVKTIQYNLITFTTNGNFGQGINLNNATIGVNGNTSTGILNNTINTGYSDEGIYQYNASGNYGHIYGAISGNAMTRNGVSNPNFTRGIHLGSIASVPATISNNICNTHACVVEYAS